MHADHFTQLFPAVCAGFGLFLAGAVNLLLLRRGLAVRTLATLAAGGLAVGAAWAINRPEAIPGAAGYFALGLIPCALLANRRLVSTVTAVVSTLHRPAVRFTLLGLAGIGVSIAAIVVFERADERATNESMAELEMLQGRVPSVASTRAKAATDQGTPVVLREPTTLDEDGKLAAAEQKILAGAQMNDKLIRRGPAGSGSNCHGWVFTGGRFLLGGEDVELILRENAYQEVFEPQAGDVVVYRQGGLVVHTALVRYAAEGQPVLVESKWGNLGIFLHPADASVYGTDYTAYRSPRAGHLLVGLGGQPASDARLPAATE